jgi:hypothetical protein
MGRSLERGMQEVGKFIGNQPRQRTAPPTTYVGYHSNASTGETDAMIHNPNAPDEVNFFPSGTYR